MEQYETFGQELQDALTHLYDPDYRPSGPFCGATGCDPGSGPVPVQAAIIQMIASIAPAPEIPVDARSRRSYNVLYHRYILKLTQEQTAERLNISVRHLNRVQREAVHTLARHLWEKSRERDLPGDEVPPGGSSLDAQSTAWRSQTKQELASLSTSAPGVVADVGRTINEVLEIQSILASRRGIAIAVGFVQPNLVASVHPSALAQMLITALGRIARYAAGERITIYSSLEDGKVKITMTSALAAEHRPTQADLTDDIMMPEDGSVDVAIDGGHVFLAMRLPSLGKSTVLVVDDNQDMAHFYRRATTGTRYHIVHVTSGRQVLGAIRVSQPDAIVLDIMLPDVDGWKLLMQLREDSTTQSIPIIVCTVVREEELALALGAAIYLPKPVQPRQFIQALDELLFRASGGAPRAPANNVAAC